MKLLRRIARQLVSLFVDDALVAAIVVAWIAIACLLLPQFLPRSAAAPLLFAGLLGIFACSFRKLR